MAGLAAARALHSKGAAVVIVEGRNRIGGRVWTAASTQGVPLDLGASWIEGVNGNPISALARRFNVPTAVTDFDNRLIYEAGGKSLMTLRSKGSRQVIRARWTRLERSEVV